MEDVMSGAISYLSEISVFLDIRDILNLGAVNTSFHASVSHKLWLNILRDRVHDPFIETDFPLESEHLLFLDISFCNSLIHRKRPLDGVTGFHSLHPFPKLDAGTGLIGYLMCKNAPFSRRKSFLYQKHTGKIGLCLDLFYFEIAVRGLPNNSDIDPLLTVGFMDQGIVGFDFLQFVGWSDASLGYHSDDGGIFHFGQRIESLQPFGAESVVGCGVDFQEMVFFFTLNGEWVADVPIPLSFQGKPLNPILMYEPPEWDFSVNFGHQPFEYHLEEYCGLKNDAVE